MSKAKEEHVKHEVKGVFDRKSIALEFKMTVDELIDFHNERCHLMERMGKSLPHYLPFVYIPAEKYRNRQNQFLKSTRLTLPKSVKNKYGVKLIYHPSRLTIHYKINTNRKNLDIVFEKEKVYVNNQEVQKVIEEFMQSVESTLYPLEVQTTNHGAMLKIKNTEEIKRRWRKDVLPKIQGYYQSEVIDSSIRKINHSIMNMNDFPYLLGQSIFYQLFCLPLYGNYSDYSKTINVSVYFSKLKMNANFIVTCTLEPEYTSSGKVLLRLKGEEELFSHEDRKKGKLELIYKFYSDSNIIFSITGSISTFNHDEEHRIEFNLFEL